MKIACISTSRVPSDTANSIQVMKACHALVQEGHEVRLIVPAVEGPRAKWEQLSDRYGISQPFPIEWIRTFPRLKRNDFAWDAFHNAQKTDVDLLYTWTIQSAVLAVITGTPVIYELHDLPTGRLGPLWFRIFLRFGKHKRLLPITRALLHAVESIYGKIDPKQVVVAPNGVDLEQYENLPGPMGARAALNLPEAPTVLCSGHLYAGRGVDIFLGLAGRFPKASFVWVGGRPEDVQIVRGWADSHALSNVQLTGHVDQRRLPLYQAAADVLLMPYARSVAGSSGGNSADFCSPMKMFDYLAAGRAILSSDLPVIHEVLNDTNACFAQPEDVDRWSKQLERLLSDRLLRDKLGVKAREDAQRYSWRARAALAVAGMGKK